MKLLEKMKPKILRRSLFGENHHAAIDAHATIDAQIYVLSREPAEDDIWNRYGDNTVGIGSAALDARQWLDGETDEKPSDGWRELIR